jgi:hypothetical protein
LAKRNKLQFFTVNFVVEHIRGHFCLVIWGQHTQNFVMRDPLGNPIQIQSQHGELKVFYSEFQSKIILKAHLFKNFGLGESHLNRNDPKSEQYSLDLPKRVIPNFQSVWRHRSELGFVPVKEPLPYIIWMDSFHLKFVSRTCRIRAQAFLQLIVSHYHRRTQVPTEKTLPHSGFEPKTFAFQVSYQLSHLGRKYP